MIEIYNKYKASGLATLPTKADKSPNYPHWKEGVNDEPAYGVSPGIGVVCGKLSGGLECLDFDNHFGDAKETISAYITSTEIAPLYEKHGFVIESTMSGGYHLLYRCDVVGGNQKLARKPKIGPNKKWVPDVIIETRGEGGYFVAAPSPGYKIIRGDMGSLPKISIIEREIMLSVAKSFNTWHEVVPTVQESRDKPGDIFNSKVEAIDEMRSALTGNGWVETREGMWRRPGKKEGITATLGKAAPGIFYNFSPNAHPFDQEVGYTAFQVVGLLEYNGDFSAFAKDLVERYDLGSKTKNINKPVPVKSTESELDKIVLGAMIDLNVPVEKPPIVVRIRQKIMKRGIPENYDSRVFTLGNFSAITGKGKSKKTFLTSLMLASATSNSIVQNKIMSDFPVNKNQVVLFDTEQSLYDAYITSSRIPRMIGDTPNNFVSFNLREYSPMERCDIIDHVFKKWGESIGYVVLDGIADLAKAINDEEEASRVVGLLMKWTKDYNCHITTVIHQNKNDNYATGHLGSSIIKKAECVITVEKDQSEIRKSHVQCDLIRGAADFDDFSFEINDSGLPIIEEDNGYRNSDGF